VILLDTHIWVWWVSGAAPLSAQHAQLLQQQEANGIGVSVISCWEVALLIARKRLAVDRPARAWIDGALAYPGVQLVALTPQIAVATTELPGDFHRDPADRILVATANALGCVLLTADGRFLRSAHVQGGGPAGS
jgi:PIN domain nuclease of toxin-antitoxin system